MRSALPLVMIGLVASCEPGNAVCGDLICPGGKVCSPDNRCVLQGQLDACVGAADADACTLPGATTGVCYGQVCIEPGCGNGVVEAGELCDDGNRISGDGCRADCRSLEICGDGVADLATGEQCDCGAGTEPAGGCATDNSNDPGATCRPDCKLARCGDGIVDPGELCDDGNTVSGDGCRGDCQGRFAKMETPTSNNLFAVWALGASNAYAVGNDGTVIHYDGVSWAIDPTPTTAGLEAVWGSGPDDIHAGGLNTLLHKVAGAWQPMAIPPAAGAGRINVIWGSGPSDVYAGYEAVNGGTSVLIHYDGATWAVVAASHCGTSVISTIWGTSSSNVFLGNAVAVCRFNGTIWGAVDSQGSVALTGTSPTDVDSLGLAEDSVRHWTGSGAFVPNAIPGFLLTLAAASPTDLLGVADSGVILQYDGTHWTHLISPTEVSFASVSATASSNVFIVGQVGTVLH